VVKRFLDSKAQIKIPCHKVRGGREGKSGEKSPFPPPFAREWYETKGAGGLARSLLNLQLRDSAGLAPASPHPFVIGL
jgi:hypothetical protein